MKRVVFYSSLTLMCFFVIVCAGFFLTPWINPIHVFQNPSSMDSDIFFQFRLTRLLLAFFVGGALSICGVSFQSLLKNPLADPYILGVSGGGSLGYVIGLVLGLSTVLLPVMSCIVAAISLICLVWFSSERGVLSVYQLLLLGVIFNAFSFAFILMLNSVVHFGQTQQIFELLLGHVDSVSWMRLSLMILVSLVCFTVLFLLSHELNLLSLGEDEAFYAGVNVEKTKILVFVFSSILVGLSVAQCGLIGFIGLLVPHVARRFVGSKHEHVLPASFLIGGITLVICEFVASQIFSSPEFNTKLPVGAVTALIGAPCFAWLLKKRSRLGI